MNIKSRLDMPMQIEPVFIKVSQQGLLLIFKEYQVLFGVFFSVPCLTGNSFDCSKIYLVKLVLISLLFGR